MQKKHYAILLFMTLACITWACQNPSSSQRDPQDALENGPQDYSLVGKKGIIVYPDFRAEVDYLSDSTLHWKTTRSNGEVNEGDERVFLRKLNDEQYFLNWIEKDGLTISQVIDVKGNYVVAYASYSDANSTRGERAAQPMEGTFELKQ